MPSTLSCFGFTGSTAPPKGLLIRFETIARPTLPGRSLAPTTATFLGRKNTSSVRSFIIYPPEDRCRTLGLFLEGLHLILHRSRLILRGLETCALRHLAHRGA